MTSGTMSELSAKLDHAVIAAAVRQWRRRLSGCVKAGNGHFEHCFWSRRCVFRNNYNLSYCCWSVEHLHTVGRFGLIAVVTLRFAIHGHCLICTVKWQHWLGEADFCCVSSFALLSWYSLQKITNMFEFVKVTSEVLSVLFYRTRYPLPSSWPHLRCDVGLEEGEYK